MQQYSWYRKLKQLNSRLEVCQFENSTHLPGLYYRHPYDGVFDICCTDVDEVPALPKYASNGQMIKSGYRRIISMLLMLKLTTKDQVKRVMGGGYFECRYPEASRIQVASVHQRWSEMMKEERRRLNIIGNARQVDVQDKIIDKTKEMEMDNFNRRGSAALSGDQFLELSGDVEKDQPAYKKEEIDRAKFNYDKAVGKRKIII